MEEEVRAPLEMVAMEEMIQNRIAERTALGEKWNVYMKQLSSGSFAVVGAEKQKAASLIKLYIMGAVYEQYDNLAAQYGAAELDRLLTAMITVSDNDAANELTRMLGGGEETAGMEQVNVYCQEKVTKILLWEECFWQTVRWEKITHQQRIVAIFCLMFAKGDIHTQIRC
mgnify:FL=1